MTTTWYDEHPLIACQREPARWRTDRRVVAARPTPAVYWRRRLVALVAVTVLAVATVAAGVGVLAGLGGVPASATETLPARSAATVIAQPGDTLWSIAHAHRGEVDHGRFVDALVRLNGGASIQAGQVVVLP